MEEGQLTRKLVEFANGLTFDDLPKAVVDGTKRVLLDSVGCALGSYVTDRAKIALEFASEMGGNPQATIIGNRRTSCPMAAFVNGELINALDYDAVEPSPHIPCYVVAPSLATGERARASGKDLITALALAFEVGGRAVRSVAAHRVLKDEPPHYGESPRFSYTPVIFGAVAGASKLLQLDVEATANAFGIAGASTPIPGMMKWEQTGGPAFMVKYNMWTGWMSQLATVSALLAERGFTGDTTIMDGEWGQWKIIGSPFIRTDVLVGDLGKRWYTPGGIKPYPACYINHTAIKALNAIILKNGIDPDDIEAISVKGDPFLLLPNRTMDEINTFEDAQFCNAYVFAVAAYHGRQPGPAWQLPSTFNNPAIQALMKRVKVEAHPKAEELIVNGLREGRSVFFNVLVEVTAKGKKFATEVTEPKGSAADPISDEELEQKFRINAGYSPIKRKKMESAIEAILDLERLDSITELTKLLAVD